MKFLCDSSAPSLWAALENQRFEPRFCQIESGDQPIVTTSDDYDIAFVGHRLGRSFVVFENFNGCETTVRAHNAAPWMRG